MNLIKDFFTSYLNSRERLRKKLIASPISDGNESDHEELGIIIYTFLFFCFMLFCIITGRL